MRFDLVLRNKMSILRPNQTRAIETSVLNDFASGIHYHATGSGKSWIAMHIILRFYEKYPTQNVMWICEKKSILIEQFNVANLKKREFDGILKKYNVLNFSEFKLGKWYTSVNSAVFWNKPVLLIMNRAFLTYNDKYKKIKLPIHLIIHDECHTIVNKTTKEFYSHMLQQPMQPKCIGFSATPNLSIEPYKNTLSSYSIYDAFIDGVIVPPKIKWFSCDELLYYDEIIHFIKQEIENPNLIYKKIIVWCGMIELCVTMAKLWKTQFEDYKICMDTSKISKTDVYFGYEDFDRFENNAILFCAAKHREGSDIRNLDCCVFLDKVENRCPKVFLQCIGRVLRKDPQNKKSFGLVLDIRAKNSLAICNRLNGYLNMPSDVFPWKYRYTTGVYHDKFVKINELFMVKHEKTAICDESDLIKIPETIEELKSLFVRELPKSAIYVDRLNFELDMLHRKNLITHLAQAIQILNLTKNIPHVTRGSCGSSLVCYLLGISHIDPVANNIKFARFLTENRNNLPDIDLDFPHNLRDEVFLKIGLTWPGKVARISNHVFYHDKSALRQAIRNAGVRKFIGKNEIDKELQKLPDDTRREIMKNKDELEDSFRCYSLHCGGIVYYPNGIPEELVLDTGNKMNRGTIQQIVMNKHDVSKEKNFKIDILSSRALSQCYEINKYKLIPFEEFTYDKLTFDMLHRGDNIGIILGESPLIRVAFMKIKPTSLFELAVCLSIIRPAAAEAKSTMEDCDFESNIIFDDDAIDIISNHFHISDEEADKYRRAFSKGDKKGINEFKKMMQDLPVESRKEMMKKLSNLSRYGFCKAHAFSYAQLIWKLAYMKAHQPYAFWKATLNNCQSSYRKWVHYYEAKLAGVESTKQLLKRDDVSIYACNRRKKIETLTVYQQLQKYGYWMMHNDAFFPGCYLRMGEEETYEFNGIIASDRVMKAKKFNKVRLFIGVAKKTYVQINIEAIRYFDPKKIGIEGRGKMITSSDKDCSIITAETYRFY